MNPVDPLQFFISCRTVVHMNNPHTSNVQIHRILCWFSARLMADFSRTAARAHSTLRCTAASPHGPLRMAYLLFGSPWASCSHLVLSHSSQFASFFFVHLPLRLRLTPRITQRVPILFQHKSARCQSLPDYLLQINEFPFTIFPTLLTLFFRLLHLVPIVHPVSSNATSPKALFPSPTSFKFPTLLLCY